MSLFALSLPLITLLLSLNGAFAASQNDRMKDAKIYLESLDEIKELPIEKQIEAWRRFLEKHPDTLFREEIDTNLKYLDELLAETDPLRKQDQRDSDRYLKVVEFAKKLSQEDQIALWEQFLEENPKTIYRREILTRLQKLRAHQIPRKTEKKKPSKTEEIIQPQPVIPHLDFKDTQKAVLLATFPGLVVPGLGHWYAADYVIGGILTGIRVAGLSIGIPGLINRNRTLIIAGALLTGFSYLVDVVDAPFAVQRYNEELELKSGFKTSFLDPIRGYTGSIMVTYYF